MIKELKDLIVEVINKSKLPIDIVLLVMENLTYSIRDQANQVYAMEQAKKAEEANESE